MSTETGALPRDLAGFVRDAERAIGAGEEGEGLGVIEALVRALLVEKGTSGVLYDAPVLDELCDRAGRQILGRHPVSDSGSALGREPHDLQVYVATELYETGGHTAVVEDFIRSQPGRPHRILVTDPDGTCDREAVARRLAAETVEIRWGGGGGDAVARVRWLQSELAASAGARTFLFLHHFDAAAVAAAQGELAGPLYFCHHGDHHLCLGVHHPTAHHFDVSPFGYHHCRTKLGVRGNFYVPLTADVPRPDPGGVPARPFTTAASGHEAKFHHPYAYHYFDLIPTVLDATGGRHFHFGPVAHETLEEVRQRLAERGQDPARFIHIPHVSSLANALADARADLYLSSFPVPGYKAAIEAMGAGVAVCGHDHYASEQFAAHDIINPEAPFWRTPDDLATILRDLDVERLADAKRQARSHFEAFHDFKGLAARLAAPNLHEAGAEPPPPAGRFRPDVLQQVLDHLHAARTERVHFHAALESAEAKIAGLTARLETTQRRGAAVSEKLRRVRAKERALEGERRALGKLWSFQVSKPFRVLEAALRRRRAPGGESAQRTD